MKLLSSARKIFELKKLDNWVEEILLAVIIGLSGGFMIASKLLGWGWEGTVQGIAMMVFSGFLVLFYSRQTNILDNQESLMEKQNIILLDEYEPRISLRLQGRKGEYVQSEIRNRGQGMAFDVCWLVKVHTPDGDQIEAKWPEVRIGDQSPVTLGAIEEGRHRVGYFSPKFPNPDGGEDLDILDAQERYQSEYPEGIEIELFQAFRGIGDDDLQHQLNTHIARRDEQVDLLSSIPDLSK